VNAGKQSMLLDVQQPSGQEIFWQLIQDADVVVENFAGGTAARYGIGSEEVLRRKPDAIYTSVNLHSRNGPWGKRRGHEQQGQAAAGISWRRSGGGGSWPLHEAYLINDVGTGVLAAFATAAALFHRFRGGEGQRVGASLSQTATLHQAAYLFCGPAVVSAPDTGLEGVNVRGWSAVNRLYQALDGWFFLAGRSSDAPALAARLRLGEQASTSGADVGRPLAEALERAFAQDTRDYWCERLRAIGFGAAPVNDLGDVVRSVAVRDRGLVRDGLDMYGNPGPSVVAGPWLSAHPPVTGTGPDPIGSATKDVLRRLDLSDDEISELASEGVIAGPDLAGLDR
jgi:crotonobetainyl-CoA:carnitine CoA-transferase CaiB-like acyl-CoA transferase